MFEPWEVILVGGLALFALPTFFWLAQVASAVGLVALWVLEAGLETLTGTRS